MVRYEVLFVTVPEITSDEAANVERQLEKVLKDNQAKLISFDRWGKYRLAYEVNDNDYGVYFLARFETESKVLKPLLDAVYTLYAVKMHDLVMRHVVARLDNKEPLIYQRPESLEEAPRSTDLFKDAKDASFSLDELEAPQA